MKSVQQHLQESLASGAYFNVKDVIYIPLNLIGEAIVTGDPDALEEFCDDNDIQYCIDLGPTRMSDLIYRITKSWHAGMHDNDHETKWEAKIAQHCDHKWTKSSKLKALVKRSIEAVSDDIGADAEPECLPGPNSAIYSESTEFAIYSDESSFGWLAPPKNTPSNHVAFIRSCIGYK